MKKRKIKEILKILDVLRIQENDYRKALISIRGKDFEEEIDKDSRASVRNLYQLYKDSSKDLQDLLNSEVPEDYIELDLEVFE